MTVFVVSLFLPFTVDFKLKPDNDEEAVSLRPSSPESPIAAKVVPDNAETLFSTQASPTPMSGPPSRAEHTNRFSHQSRSSRGSLVLDLSKTSRVMTPNEAHSPLWGRTSYFHQPELRARELPVDPIIPPPKQAKHIEIGTKESRASSHEREALKTAEWSVYHGEQGNVALRNAVFAAVKSGTLKEKTWIGTIGMPTDALQDERKDEISEKLETDYECLAVFAKDSDFNGHYSHFCKVMLWPVLHYQIPDHPKSKAYQDHSWVYYVKINELFADKIIKNYKKGDVIWIHDYHLLLVPGMVRKKLSDAQIGFFLHTAFPSSEVFRCLAVRRELLEGMLGANLIGFQTDEYCHHFLQTCNRLLSVEALETGVQLEDRFIDVAKFPVGIDSEILDIQRKDPEVLMWLGKLQEKYEDKQLIVARDKLDPISGVRDKLLAYETLLKDYPELRGNVVLIQLTTSTTEQTELDLAISGIMGRIAAKYSTLSYQPVVYLKQDLEYAQYLALVSAADALMITSLREGMNLTSHEFVICQDGKYSSENHEVKKHGSLILSEFTGTATVFQENHLAINPWDKRQCAAAMNQALTMSAEERTQRWTALRDIVAKQTADSWLNTFLQSLQKAHEQHTRQHTTAIPRLSVNELAAKYKTANKRLFMLDFEGTLVHHGSPKSIPFINPQRTITALNSLLEASENIVYVMSGRKPEELESLFTRVPGLGLIAENGGFIKEPGAAGWHRAADLEAMLTWKEGILKILEYYHERIEGSYVEERHCSIIFHCRDAKDRQSADRASGECANHINDGAHNINVHAIPYDGGVLIESTECTKATAAVRIFENLTRDGDTVDFLLVAGDSREDEFIYRWANQLGKQKTVRDVTTVSVSSRNTEAMATLTQGVTGVLSALQKLAAS